MIRIPTYLRFISGATLVALLMLLSACSTSNDKVGDAKTIEGLPTEFQRLSEVWRLLTSEQIDGSDLDAVTISDGAIRGMLLALGDPYASFLNS